MGEGKHNTRSKIIELGAELLVTQGYSGFSYADIAGQLGIKKASIHHHFPRKAELGAAIVERSRLIFQAGFEAAPDSLPPVKQLDLFFQSYLEMAGSGDRVCVGGVLEAEYSHLNEDIREALRKMVAVVRDGLTGILKAGAGQGDFHIPGGDEREFALLMLSSLQGALQVSRVMGKKTMKIIMAQFKNMLLNPP